MFINPKAILDQGIIQLPANVNADNVLQPNGIDLQVAEIFRIENANNTVFIGDDIATRHLPTTKLIGDSQNTYKLEKFTSYKIETGYKIQIPDDMVAYIFTRSTLNRNGILVGSGLWDSGFKGFVGTTLYPFKDVCLHLPCRVAQIAFLRAESAHLYAGTYNQK